MAGEAHGSLGTDVADAEAGDEFIERRGFEAAMVSMRFLAEISAKCSSCITFSGVRR